MKNKLFIFLALLCALLGIFDPTEGPRFFQVKLYVLMIVIQSLFLIEQKASIKAEIKIALAFLAIYFPVGTLIQLLFASNQIVALAPLLISTIGGGITLLIRYFERRLKLKNSLSLGAISLLFTALFRYFFGNSSELVAGAIAYCTLGYYLKQQQQFTFSVIISALFFLLILELPMGLFLNSIILPAVFFSCLSFFIGAGVYPIYKIKHRMAIALYFVLIGWLTYYGQPNYRAWYYQKSTKDIAIPAGLSFHYAATKEPLTIDDFRGKITILDLYNNYCGICFQKFPDLEQVYQRYKEDEEVQVFAVNIQTLAKGDNEELLQKLIQTQVKDKDLHFDVLKADSSYAYLSEKLEFEGVPHILVLDPNLNIVYRGQLNVDTRIKVGNIFDVIERAKK